MGGVVSTTIGNRYHKKIWVKCDVERKYVQMENYAVRGQVGVGGISGGAGLRTSKKYDWHKIEMQFSPIKPGDYKRFDIDCKDVSVVYVTIIADDEEIVCNSIPRHKDRNIVITENAEYRTADKNDPWAVADDVKRNFEIKKADIEEKVIDKDREYRNKTDQDERRDDRAETKEDKSLRRSDVVARRQDISQIIARKLSCFSVEEEEGEDINDIRGVVVTSSGTLLVAEFLYKKIKSISPEYKLLSVLKLSDGPQNIILLNKQTVVTGTRDKKLYILNISDPVLSVQKQIPLEYVVSDIVYYEGQLIVTAMTKPTSLKMITLKGQEIWSVSLDFFPRSVAYTFVNKKATLIGTDGNKNRLCFLDASNGSLIKSLAVEGKGPESVTVDKYGNVYVSYKTKREICVWSNNFRQSRILLSGEELYFDPEAMGYDDQTDRLYILYGYHNKIDCFQLQ